MELSADERKLLLDGVNQWAGPANCTHELAVAMGFAGIEHFHDERARFTAALQAEDELAARDWTQILVMTSYVFIEDTFGAGLDWPIVTGRSDDETVAQLRVLSGRFLRAGAGRRELAATSHEEQRSQRTAATAIRLFRSGRTPIGELVETIDLTVEHFGADLRALEQLRETLHVTARASESDRRDAALAAVDDLVSGMREREGHRRGFWV